MRSRTICMMGLLLCGHGLPVGAQGVAVEGMVGTRQIDTGEAMLVLEVRTGMSPRNWAVRPTIGLATAAHLLGSQFEITLGAHADVRTGRLFTFSGGGGVAHLSQDGGTWNSGSSTGLYLQAAGFVNLRRPLMLGLDARYLTAPPFTRKDGLEQEVSFLQLSLNIAARLRP